MRVAERHRPPPPTSASCRVPNALVCPPPPPTPRRRRRRHHYPAILRLKQFFPFHLIDAMGSLADTQEQIGQVCACERVDVAGWVGASGRRREAGREGGL